MRYIHREKRWAKSKGLCIYIKGADSIIAKDKFENSVFICRSKSQGKVILSQKEEL